MNYFYNLLILASMIHRGTMDSSDFGSSEGDKGSGVALDTVAHHLLPVELIGPKSFVALGGNNLTVGYRLSPAHYNMTMISSFPYLLPLSFQLIWLQEDGQEECIASQDIHPSTLSFIWHEVIFECGLIVRGGNYNVRLAEIQRGADFLRSCPRSGETMSGAYDDYFRTVRVMGSLAVRVDYPVIDFEVPHRLETYTTAVPVTFGLTRSLCKPKLPLPSTILTLSLCKQSDRRECTRDFVTVLRDPFLRLQSEGQVTVDVECHFWGKNATYRVQIQEESTNQVISMSEPIKVEWSSRFSLNLTTKSILPCLTGKTVRVLVSYPSCVLPEKDKIRVYGHEPSVPSLLAVNRLNYIGEKQIRPSRRVVMFSCSLFTPRFSRYCFQYISTAVDDSVSVVVEKCLPTFSPDKFSDGGWGAWSDWSPCSNTCGTRGKQFRYRFCDSPLPAFGANFCQGDSVEERSCDSLLPDCATATETELDESTLTNEETLNSPQLQLAMESGNSFGFIPLHPSLNMNLSTTVGCECGCILDEILPGINYTLVVVISSNQSSCGDQDEEDHHHLKWILNGKGQSSRIRLDVVDVDLHCMKIAFRDGNTSDSNLLNVFTSSRSRSEVRRESKEPGEADNEAEREEHETMSITVESTGSSMSIAASESNGPNQNDCHFQFLYLVAYYQAASFAVQQENPLEVPDDWIAYKFWTFLFVKLVLSVFVIIVLCSTFGGCATKVYTKYKYRQLKLLTENDSLDDTTEGVDGDGTLHPNVSRCTSITLMSFDYSYWTRIRTLRLKHFLLKPKPLNKIITKVKSYPSTPTHPQPGQVKSKSWKQLCKLSDHSPIPPANRTRTSIHYQKVASDGCTMKSHVSDSDLRLKISIENNPLHSNPLVVGGQDSSDKSDRKEPGPPLNQRGGRRGSLQCNCCGGQGIRVAAASLSEGSSSTMSLERDCCNRKYTLIARSVSSSSQDQSQSKKGRPSFISVVTPEDFERNNKSPRPSRAQLNDKYRKEKENLKRRQLSEDRSERAEKLKKSLFRKFQRSPCPEKGGREMVVDGSSSGSEEVVPMTVIVQRNRNKSNLSVTSDRHGLGGSVSNSVDSQEGLDFGGTEGDQDFEMDYYDYDVLNAGNIPGSYLGLEPAFVLWNSEMYDHPQGDEEEDDATTAAAGMSFHESHLKDNNSDSTASSMEMMDLQSNLIHSHSFQHPLLHIKESSLQTLKFVDDDDEEDDDDDDNNDEGCDGNVTKV